MRCLKAFGERIAARDSDRQTAEINIRITVEPLSGSRNGRDRSRRLLLTGKALSCPCLN